MKVTDKTETFVSALNVMNTAVEKNRDTFPYKQICTVGEKLIGGKNLGVAVYADDASTPHDFFTICWKDNRLELVAHGKEDPAMIWKVPQSYLEDVVENSEEYINHPGKLDWNWMMTRLGIAKDS